MPNRVVSLVSHTIASHLNLVPLPGLFVANMFQVNPHDRGQNYSVELAERLVRHLDE